MGQKANPIRVTECAGAADGCGWSGVAAEQAAHEASCPAAVRLRLMVSSSTIELLQHDAPPSCEEVEQMGVVAAVATLRAHGVAEARVAEEACARVAGVCREDEGNRQPAVDAGALTAVVAAMQAHPQVVGVQGVGIGALLFVCSGINAAAPARKQRAVAAGALEAVVAAMQAHPQEVGVQQRGCVALSNVCGGTDAEAPARNQRAVTAGALEAVAAAQTLATQAHPQVVSV